MTAAAMLNELFPADFSKIATRQPETNDRQKKSAQTAVSENVSVSWRLESTPWVNMSHEVTM